jgi:ribosome-associated heat shock protein Hsp15
MARPVPPEPVEGVRLDIWLDIACLFRTRSDAQKACRNGKVQVNRQTAKPNRLVRPDDGLIIRRPFGRRQIVRIRALAERHVSRARARELYEDLTPPPTAEEVERRRFERTYRAAVTPPTAPSRDARRLLRKMKESQE